jgi:hypothetical protein
MAGKLGTQGVVEQLAQRYAAPEYAFFREVGSSTGATHGRRADGLAISLWPSRGLTIEAFEVKVSRGDWMKELKNPAKGDAIGRYCDRFWLVVSDAAIVKPGELPNTWGLMVAGPNGLTTEVKATDLKPAALDRTFVAAIARRAAEQSSDAKIARAAYEKGYEAGQAKERSRSKDGAATEALLKLQQRVMEFQNASGINFAHTSDPIELRRLGEATSFVLHGEANVARRVRQLAKDLQNLQVHLETVAAECDPKKTNGASR